MFLKHLCSVVLWLWYAVNINAHSYTNVPSVVYDWTKPLTALMAQNISYEEFIESLAFLPNGELFNVSVIYSLDCNITKDCADKIDEVENFFEKTFNNTLSIDLIISVTINEEDLMFDLDERKMLQLRKPKFKTKILANINDSLIDYYFLKRASKGMDLHTLSNFSSTSRIGLGYNQTLIDEDFFKFDWLRWIGEGFVVGKYEIGVVESYGLFRKRMNRFYKQSFSFLEEELRIPKSSILSYPNQNNFGDLCHQQLFIDYIKMWLKDIKIDEGSGVIVKEQNIRERSTTPRKFSLIGYILSPPRHIKSVPILKTIYQHFSHLWLSYKQWVTLNTEMRNNSAKNYVNPTPGKELEIILHVGKSDLGGSNRLVVEKKFSTWKAEKWSETVVLKTVVFDFFNYTTKVRQREFAIRLSSQFIVGCSFFEDYNLNLTATSMVKACKEINGTLYILHKRLYMSAADVLPQDKTFEYENLIKKPLEEMKKLGNSILTLHPEASILLWVSLSIVWERHRPTRFATTFCDQDILAVNEHFEAILNWAKCSNLKIVIKPGISFDGYASWLSILRPVIWLPEGISFDSVAMLHPYFVLRNYPNHFKNWTIDPCIDATTVRPNMTGNFFQNKTIGITFNTEDIRRNATLTTDEYKIMLQFVLHKFDLVGIVLPKNYEDLIEAFKWIESQNKKSVDQKTILLSYVFRKTHQVSIHAELANFVEFIGHLKRNELKFVKGIHLDLYESLEPFTNHTKLLAVETSLTQLQNMSIRIGLLVNTPCCLEFVRLFVSTNSKIHSELKFLKKIHYLICKEEHSTERMENLKNMDRIFDTHLYLKKAIQEFLPDLNLYFNVEINVHQRNLKFHLESYMIAVSNSMKFAASYEINYFLINAFDRNYEELELNEQNNKNGWWEISNYTSLSDPSVYKEKEAVYQRHTSWKPEPLKKDSTTDSEINSYFPSIPSLVAGAAVTLSLAFGLFYYLRLRKLNQFLSKDEIKEFFNGSSKDSNHIQTGSMAAWKAEYLKFQANFEIELMDLQIEAQTILGIGNFGTVHKGIAKETLAAIKKPNKNCTKDLFKSLLSEVKLLSYIGEHENVVGFIGAYTKEIHRGVLYIATELCKNGSLEKFLRQKKHVATSAEEGPTGNPFEGESLFMDDLCKFSHQIASGMEYIEGKHVVHGDLAARNILLDDNHKCKIGDFGLSRKLYEYQKYIKKSQEPLPWKWMAYESLTTKEFTSKSDVWSFGVTIWEIFSLGNIPYDTVHWSLDFTDQLKNGLRLNKPAFSSDKIYMKMLDCWNLDGVQRPSFTEMACFFKELGYGQYILLDENEKEFLGDSVSDGSQDEDESTM